MSTSIKKVLWQGVMYPKNFLKGRMQTPSETLETLQPDTGAIIEIDGKKVAAYKDANGQVTKHSAICTHLGCVVGWNGAEKTWDCPCHGSRFSTHGKVINGPAVKDLPAA